MLKKCLHLYQNYEEIINYIIVGGLTTFVSLAVYYGCVLTFLDPEKGIQLQMANVLSWIAGVAFAYVTNRKYVFKSKSTAIFKELVAFVSARASTLILDMVVMFVWVTLLSLNDKIGKIVSMVLVMIANYVFSKLFVFKKTED